MKTIDTGLIAFRAGLKPGLRLEAPAALAAAMEERFAAAGGATLRVSARLHGREVEMLYIARSTEEARQLRDAEADILPDGSCGSRKDSVESHRRLGLLLGYPACCVDAFCARIEAGMRVRRPGDPGGFSEDYLAARDAWVPRPIWLLNNLLRRTCNALVHFYPCRYDCAVAARGAQALWRAVQTVHGDDSRALAEVLSRPVVIAPAGERALVALEGSSIADAWPAALDDEAFAASLRGRQVDARGFVRGLPGGPAPLCLDFGALPPPDVG